MNDEPERYVIERDGDGRFRVRNTETGRVVVDYVRLDVARRAKQALDSVIGRAMWPDALDVEKTLPAE